MSLKQTAMNVLNLLERGSYTSAGGAQVSIAAAQQASVQGSVLYRPDRLADLRQGARSGAIVPEVVEGTTQRWARELGDQVVLLNFASARNPGGGFLNGAKAQEEDLCRCSGLYPSLPRHFDYYKANRDRPSLLYTDHAIYTPRVPFFRVRGRGDLLDEPFLASVITMPAPNTGPYLRRDGDPVPLEQAFERRWRNVLAIARDQGHRVLLLGAWGCGAFGGDPTMAAQTAARALAVDGDFDRVVFAIPGKGKRSAENLRVFTQVLTPGS